MIAPVLFVDAYDATLNGASPNVLAGSAARLNENVGVIAAEVISNDFVSLEGPYAASVASMSVAGTVAGSTATELPKYALMV